MRLLPGMDGFFYLSFQENRYTGWDQKMGDLNQ